MNFVIFFFFVLKRKLFVSSKRGVCFTYIIFGLQNCLLISWVLTFFLCPWVSVEVSFIKGLSMSHTLSVNVLKWLHIRLYMLLRKGHFYLKRTLVSILYKLIKDLWVNVLLVEARDFNYCICGLFYYCVIEFKVSQKFQNLSTLLKSIVTRGVQRFKKCSVYVGVI